MAEEKEDISYREADKRSASSSDDNETEYVDENLRMIAVIESNDEKCLQVPKISASEVILLDEAPTTTTTTTTITTNNNNNARDSKFFHNPRVIELSDNKSKMELRRQFKLDDIVNLEISAGDSCDSRISRSGVDENNDGSADILSRLPPGTVLIKQNTARSATATTTATIKRSCSRQEQDSDYVHDSSKDSTGTNSSENSSAASYAVAAAGKIKRMQYRAARNKKIVEVRRNPARNKKKKPIEEDLSQRPRQRLLAAKRKSASASYIVDTGVTRKRTRNAPTPHMNTRSVTRKMYNVGATYQAPTPHDAIEWKEWPSHGMHERPIWHPQVGLAYEYNNRNFVSLDDETYREIIDEPVIEVVSVDPHHPERMSMAYGRRMFEHPRPLHHRHHRHHHYHHYHTTGSLDPFDRGSNKLGNSFQACMHGSFHSVLAYCARVGTPTYKKIVDMKHRTFSHHHHHYQPQNFVNAAKMRFMADVAKNSHGAGNTGPLLVPAANGAGISAPFTISKNPETSSNLPSTSSASNEIPKCLVIPRKMIHYTNVRNIQGNMLQEVFSRSSKNTLIFLKPTDPPGKTAEKIAAALKNSSLKMNHGKSKDNVDSAEPNLNLTKLDDNAISDETLMEMSSIYNNILSNEADIETSAVSAKPENKPVNYTIRPVTAIVATKISKPSDNESSYSGYINEADRPATKNLELANPPRYAYSNQAAEIAKILAEYNEKASENTPMRNTYYSSSNILNVRSKEAVNTVHQCCFNNQDTRNSLFSSIGEHPQNVKPMNRDVDMREKAFFDYQVIARQEYGHNRPGVTATVTSEGPEQKMKKNDDDIQAMDLTTAKPREIKNENDIGPKPNESRKWLQDLIEDTALLYCAAAGVHQDDVAEYLKTLDPAKSIQWLGP